MRKIIGVSLCLALLAVLVSVGILLLKKMETPFEKTLPSGALFYVKFPNARAAFEKITATQFWKGLQTVDYDLLGTASWKEKMTDPAMNAALEKFLGREFALAVYPPDFSAFNEASLEAGQTEALLTEFLSGLFFAARVPPDVQAAEALSGLWGTGEGEVKVETLDYKNQAIRLISLPQIPFKLGIVRFKDIVVAGVGEKAMRRIVDVRAAGAETLASDAYFQKVSGRFAESPDMTGFLDMEEAVRVLYEGAGRMAALTEEGTEKDQMKRQWERLKTQTAGLKVLTFSGRWEAVAKLNVELSFDNAQLDPAAAFFYRCPSAENKTLRFTPKDVLGYQWSNCLDLSYSWDQIKKELDQAAVQARRPALGGVKDIEQIMGLSIQDDILPAFGDEIGGYLQDIQLSGPFPYPQILFFIKVADSQKAGVILEKLKSHQPALFQNENYKEVTITYAALPLGAGVQPGYCFLGDYLLIALNRQMLKASIDTYGDPSASLPRAESFGMVDFGLSGRNRSVQFIRFAELTRQLEGVVEWSQTWMASQEAKKDAFQSGSRKRLADVEAQMASKKNELEQMKGLAARLEDEIWNLNSQKRDASSQQGQLDVLKESVKSQEAETASMEEQRRDLEKIVQGYETQGADKDKRARLITGVVRPLLRSLGFIRSAGIRTFLEGDVFFSDVFLKVE